MKLDSIAWRGRQFENWSRTYSCFPELFLVPDNVDQIREILYLAKIENKKVRVVGCGASPSDICCTDDYLISLEKFNKVLQIREDCVIVQAGIKLSSLNKILDNHNAALPIMGSISESTIGGVISTGTHGTGANVGIIADYVQEISMVLPSGDILKCSSQSNQEYFYSALCGLGAIGIIFEVRVRITEAFYLHQLTYPSTLENVLENLDELVQSCDHFRFLWFPHTNYVSVSITNRVDNESFDVDQLKPLLNKEGVKARPDFPYRLTSEKTWWQKLIHWAVNYGLGYHALQFAYWVSTRFPKMVPFINRGAFWLLYSSPSVQLDVSHKVFNFECLFNQYVNEWSIPITQTTHVLTELRETLDTLQNSSRPIYAHFPVEVRFASSSEIYLAPTQGRASAYINIISYRPYRQIVEHERYWQLYEGILKPIGGRPHWAKAHHETAQDFVRMYPLFRKWIQVRNRADPTKMFFNAYMNRIFGSFATNDSRPDELPPMNFFSPPSRRTSTPINVEPEPLLSEPTETIDSESFELDEYESTIEQDEVSASKDEENDKINLSESETSISGDNEPDEDKQHRSESDLPSNENQIDNKKESLDEAQSSSDNSVPENE